MADENDERNREEIFYNIMNLIKEYTTEDITDLGKAKAEIVELLKTHRPVKIVDFEYGLSHALKKDYRLIIKEENDKEKVREYAVRSINTQYSYCTLAGSKRVKCYSSAKLKYGILFASKNHVENCVAKEYSYVLQVQNALKQKRTSEMHQVTTINKPGVHQSLSTSMLNESTISTTEIENFKESNLDDTSASIASNLLSSAGPTSSTVTFGAQTFPRPRFEEDLEDNDYCMIFDEPAAKRPKTEPNVEEIFSFDLPSAVVLKEKCEKLKIGYNKEAYKFWGQIEFDKIITVSDKIQTHEFKSPNIFACLSLLFTGKCDSCFFIQHAINSAYRDELSTSSSLTLIESDQMFACTSVSDDQIEFIAKFLECRIGIYENRKLKKYGNWDTGNNCFALVLTFTNEMYSIVFGL